VGPTPVRDVLWTVLLPLGAFAVARVAALVSNRLIARAARWMATPTVDVIAKQLPAPLRWLLPAVAVDVALELVPIRGPVVRVLTHVVAIATICGVAWLGFRVLKILESVIRQRREAAGASMATVTTRLRALRNVGVFAILLVAIAASLMTFEAVRDLGTGVLASAGVAGIVVGFAAQHTLATVFAGIHIALAEPMRIGDFIVVEGESGYVEEIKLTYVIVRRLDLRRVVVPIQYLIDKPFENWTRKGEELVGAVEVHFDYTVPVDEIRAELARILHASEHWNGNVMRVQVTDAGEWTTRVRLQMSAKDRGTAWDLECEVREKIVAWAQRAHPDALPRLRSADGALGSRMAT
jgi:small-conductance mechanosensitive channel